MIKCEVVLEKNRLLVNDYVLVISNNNINIYKCGEFVAFFNNTENAIKYCLESKK